MFQNIKVDIIYYNTATDFEMEFNLSGCCRMRLLTDKAPDRKTLVNQLVRAVSRSRIIIMTGALFGEQGIINTCRRAINRPLVSINSSEYSIKGDESIEIMSGAVPLVSSDGIFGGCIIEQGPQTLILLSENKNVRKNIMQTLIHPYVKEVCAGELTESKPEVSDKAAEIALEENLNASDTEIEPIPTETDETDTVEDSVECDEPVADTTVLEEKPETKEIENTYTEALQFSSGDLKEFDYSFTNDLIQDDAAPTEAVDDKPLEFEEITELSAKTKKAERYSVEGDKKSSGNGINIPIIIISCILLLTVVVLCYALFASGDSNGLPTGEYIKETFNTLLG